MFNNVRTLSTVKTIFNLEFRHHVRNYLLQPSVTCQAADFIIDLKTHAEREGQTFGTVRIL